MHSIDADQQNVVDVTLVPLVIIPLVHILGAYWRGNGCANKYQRQSDRNDSFFQEHLLSWEENGNNRPGVDTRGGVLQERKRYVSSP